MNGMQRLILTAEISSEEENDTGSDVEIERIEYITEVNTKKGETGLRPRAMALWYKQKG